jgi:hypothetical protein
MTVTAAKSQAKAGPAPAKAATAPPTPPAPSRRRGITPLTPMRVQAAKSMTKLADSMKESHPDMLSHQHVRDAARMLRAGNEEAAQRHLRAAMFSLTPQSLMRNGMHTDDDHIAARDAMHGVHRHLLLVKDVADVAAKNQAAIRRDSYDDDSSSPPPVTSPVRADPNAGYGPGALAQKPTVRQPPGDQALNAPARSSGGGSDPAVADPVGVQPRGSKQFATRNGVRKVTELAYGWDDLAAVIIELAKPWLPSAEYWKSVGSGGGNAPKDKGGSDEEKASNHIADAKKASATGMHQAAASHLARASALTSDPAKQAKINAVGKGAAGLAVNAGQGSAFKLASTSSGVELSAETGKLAATPAPRGKPGGPGLYGAKGNMHSPYMQNIVKALIEKRGMDPGKAYAVAWGAMRKWSRGGGKVHPEVRAAAAGGLGLEKAAEARAHAHAASWSDVGRRIDLAATPAPAPAPAVAPVSGQAGGALPARVAAGSTTGGQFSAGGGGQPSQGKTAATGKTTAKPPLTAHQQHVAHVAHLLKVSTAKAGLLVTAQDDRQKAAGLIKQKNALVKAMASAGGKASTGQAGAKTAKTATTKTTAPAAAKTAAASTTAAKPAASAAAKKSTTAAKPSASATSAAGLKTQVAALNTQISALLAQASQATAQAAKMK